jgi:hypothetical protein
MRFRLWQQRRIKLFKEEKEEKEHTPHLRCGVYEGAVVEACRKLGNVVSSLSRLRRI